MDGKTDDHNIVIPGQRLCEPGEDVISGHGTHERDGVIYSSLAGLAEITESQDGSKKTVSVRSTRSQHHVPKLGGLVTCRITQATPRFCKADIIAVEDSLFEIPFRGLLRKEDIRATEKDKVEVHNSFKPNDIVLCRVISVGDSQSYILSTAENELGVIVATSEAGAPMVPISWKEMQCPKTLTIENRKAAKPTSSHILSLRKELSGQIGG